MLECVMLDRAIVFHYKGVHALVFVTKQAKVRTVMQGKGLLCYNCLLIACCCGERKTNCKSISADRRNCNVYRDQPTKFRSRSASPSAAGREHKHVHVLTWCDAVIFEFIDLSIVFRLLYIAICILVTACVYMYV